MEEVFAKLEKLIEIRQSEAAESSYVATLWDKGDDYILKKIGEEAAELIIAGKNRNKSQIVNELADLLFHATVLLKYNQLSMSDAVKVIESRLGRSGIEEKKARVK